VFVLLRVADRSLAALERSDGLCLNVWAKGVFPFPFNSFLDFNCPLFFYSWFAFGR
jgi:hypothetical protein